MKAREQSVQPSRNDTADANKRLQTDDGQVNGKRQGNTPSRSV